MSHVDDGTFHAFLDGEITGGNARRVEAHVQDCDDCARRLDRAAREHALAGELVDAARASSAPLPDWGELVRRAGREAPAPAAGVPLKNRPADRSEGMTATPDTAGRAETRSASAAWTRGLAWAATLGLAFVLGWEASRLSPPGEPTSASRAPAEARREPIAEESAPTVDSARPPSDPGTPGAPQGDAAGVTERPESAARTEERPQTTGASEEALSMPPSPDRARPASTDRDSSRQDARPAPSSAPVDASDTTADVPEAVGGSTERRSELEIGASDEMRLQKRLTDPATTASRPGISADTTGYRSIGLQEAAAWLGRPPLELEGADLLSAAIGPPEALPGGLPGRPVLRLEYRDRRSDAVVLLLQQSLDADGLRRTDGSDADATAEAEIGIVDDPGAGGSPGVHPGTTGLPSPGSDPELTVDPDGNGTLRWLHPGGSLVVLRADVSEVALPELAGRVR